jgi:NAD(P)-dependent dehydrogenase (short-subunit alcohol dehydrogenase family)
VLALSEKALEGRVVAVTGAARGIGAGIVEAALAAGARVATATTPMLSATSTPILS